MGQDLTLTNIPLVLDDDEIPGVLAFSRDPRPCLDVRGVEYRRGVDRCTIDWELGDVRLRAIVLAGDGMSFLMAFVGPMLNDWWPMLRKAGVDCTRPLLSAGVSNTPQEFQTPEGKSVNLVIVPSSEEFDGTSVVGALQGSLADEVTLLSAHMFSLAAIKAALLLTGEYRRLLTKVPNVDVEVGGSVLPLEAWLDIAQDAAEAITWKHVGS